MRISFDKINEFDVKIIEYLSEDILKFELLNSNIMEKKWTEYKTILNSPLASTMKFIDEEIAQKGYAKIGTRDELMKLNLEHCLTADFYYSNGQKIVSVVKKKTGFEMGIHSGLTFCSVHKFSLESLFLKSFDTKEKLISVITILLSNINIRKIPLAINGNNEYVEIRPIFFFNYVLKYKEKVMKINTSYPNKPIDYQFEKFIASIRPKVVICCLNCEKFRGIKEGHVNTKENGYCEIMKINARTKKQTITNMWAWCDKFKEKKYQKDL